MQKIDLAICFILLTISEIFFKLNLGLTIKPLGLLLSFSFLIAFVLVADLLKKRGRIILESTYIIVWNIYLFTQHYYYLFFKNLWSIFNLNQVNELTGVFGEVIDKFNPILLVYWLFIVIWFVLIKVIKIKEGKPRIVSTVWIFLIVTLNMFILNMNVSYYDNYIGRLTGQSEIDYLYQEMLDKPNFVQEFGVPEYIKRDITKALKLKRRKPTKEEIALINDWSKIPETNELTGIFEGRNLIVIQAESLAKQAINPVLTPTLYKLTQEGWNFENYYAPLYPANTNDTEFIIQTGLIPSIQGSTTSYRCEDNYFPNSLANAFKDNGYNVNSYHSFFGEFYNRFKMHETLGFEHFYDLKELLPEHVQKSNGLYWADDIELMKAYTKNTPKEPYYSFIITTSGHMPYNDNRTQLAEEYNIVKEYWGDKYNDEIAYYQATQMKLDKAIEYLIEQNPDAVFVLFGDHYPYTMDEESQDKFLESGMDRLKVPFIIYSKDIEHKTITTVRSTFDVHPTINNLFNLKKPVLFGVDAMSENQSTVYLMNGEIITNEYRGISEETLAWEIGELILNTDYYKYQN